MAPLGWTGSWVCLQSLTAQGFDQVQVHVDYLSGKIHAVPTKSTDTAADTAQITLNMALRSGDGVLDVLVTRVDQDPKFTSKLLREFKRCIGSSHLVGSAYHKITNAKMERVNGVLNDTLLWLWPQGRLGLVAALRCLCYR